MQSFNLDKYLRPADSPISQNKGATSGIKFDMQNEIQGRFANLSNINIKNFVFQASAGNASFSLVNNGSAVITSRASNNPPHQSESMFGQIYTAIYEGTAAVGSLQIFPGYGSGVNPLSYRIWGGRDWQKYNENTTLGDTENYVISLVNVAGSTQSFYFANQVKYIQYNANKV